MRPQVPKRIIQTGKNRNLPLQQRAGDKAGVMGVFADVDADVERVIGQLRNKPSGPCFMRLSAKPRQGADDRLLASAANARITSMTAVAMISGR